MAPRPGDVIPVAIEAAMGADLTAAPGTWTWTELSTRLKGQATIVRGRADEAQQTQPATLTIRLGNNDGWLTPRHPSSPWYLLWALGTPLRLKVTIPGDATYNRFQGRVTIIKPVWPAGNSDVAFVDVTVKGALYSLQQGSPPLRSALFRSISTSSPFAYWPLEEGPQADHLVAIGGGTAVSQVYLNATGPAEFGALRPPTGASTMPNFIRGGSLILQVSSQVSTAWTLEFSHFFGTGEPARGDYSTPSSMNLFVAFASNGDYWEFQVTPHNAIFPNGRVALFRSDGDEVIFDTLVDVSLAASYNPWDGRTHHVAVTAAQSGSNINWQLFLDGSVFASGTLLSRTLRPMDRVMLNQNGFLASSSVYGMGHVAFYESVIAPASHAQAAQGWSGETATARLARLGAEEGVPLVITGTSDIKMGPQPTDTLYNVLRQCEDADGGILTDGLNAGLNYLARSGRYNQPVALALDANRAHVKWPPFDPLEDDQRLRTKFTVSRINGSSATFTDPSAKTRGEYPGQANLSLADDSTLGAQASWRTHLFTVPEMRTPVMVIDVRNSPELLTPWLTADIGERYTAANPPVQYPPGGLDLVLEQYTEVIDGITWRVRLTGSPNGPWRVSVVGQDRVDTAGSQLDAPAPAVAGALTVLTTTGPVWSFAKGAFDISVGGLRYTVNAITNALNSNPFFEVNASGWTATDGSIARSTAQFHEGVASLLLTPSGTGPAPRTESGRAPVSAGVTYRSSAWVRCAVARTVEVDIAWYTAANVFLSSSVTSVAVAATTWTQITTTATPPATATQAACLVGMTGTPPSSHLLWIDEAMLVDPVRQVFTVTPVGPSAARPVGAPVRLWNPAVVAL